MLRLPRYSCLASKFLSLISSLSVYATTDKHGFLVTPYRRVKNGRITDETVYLRADEEAEARLAPADTELDERNRIVGTRVVDRVTGNGSQVRGISSIDNVALLRLEGDGMVGVPGVAQRLFGALASEGVVASLGQFVGYALGMGVVIFIVNIGAALFKRAMVRWLRTLTPYVHRLSAMFLIGAGAYLIYYWIVTGRLS